MVLIKDVDFQPIDKLVITFDKWRTYSTDYTILDNEKNKGRDPLKDEMETKVVKKKVKYTHQFATILSVPETETVLLPGDQVLVDFHACIPLDGYLEIYIIYRHNIIGKKII